MIFLYTRYKDMGQTLPASVSKIEEFIMASQLVERQTNLDNRLREVLKKKDLHVWPKKNSELDSLQNGLLQLYREYNDSNLAIFLVMKDDYALPEKGCHMLVDGGWKQFKDFQTATDKLYGLDSSCPCVNHRVVYNG